MKTDMAKIPYIVHKARMFQVYKEKKRIKTALVITNVIWALALLLLVLR